MQHHSASTQLVQTFLHKTRSLDLGPLAYQLMQSRSGLHWTKSQTVAAIARYLAFLYLIDRYPRLQLVPTQEIDHVWHQHILDTQKYAEDCQQLFGRFIHHFPYLGTRGDSDRHTWERAYALTQVLFRQYFCGVDLVDAVATDCEPLRSLNSCCHIDATTRNGTSLTAHQQRPTVEITVDEILEAFSNYELNGRRFKL